MWGDKKGEISKVQREIRTKWNESKKQENLWRGKSRSVREIKEAAGEISERRQIKMDKERL